ncbi:MAG: hypothetical protein JWP72_3403 [Massilia sp.]|nr:hypothetical protein [Massilia sp.]
MPFYKYTNIPTANLIIENQTMRWSSPVVFNDVEECQFVPFTKERIAHAYKKYQEILIECAKGNLPENYNSYSVVTKMIVSLLQITSGTNALSAESLAEIMKTVSGNFDGDFRQYVNAALIKCFRVLCVTTDFENKLMWAHYADQHRGCVLELDKFFDNEPRGLRAGYVRYHENLEPASNPLDILLCGETKEASMALIDDVVFSKRTLWNYENEYRYLFNESFGEITTTIDMATNNRTIKVKNQPEVLYTDVPFSLNTIKSITFGVRANTEDIDQISGMLIDKGSTASFYQMQMQDGRVVRTDLERQFLRRNR